MSSAQKKTIDLYQTMMQINASAHLMRAARQVGLLDELEAGQKTIEDICTARFLHRESTQALLDALVAIGIIERYDDDYALSQAARLLSQYDRDLRDEMWDSLPDLIRGKTQRNLRDDRLRMIRDSANQWIHTAAAMQAAEMLDIGGEDGFRGIHLLDLGSGSAVWSCAMAHRDPELKVTAVDFEEAIGASRQTADSIGLGDRFETIAGDPAALDLQPEHYDMVFVGQRLHTMDDDSARRFLARCIEATKPGGTVVVVDLFFGPHRQTLSESIEALKLVLETQGGYIRTLPQAEAMFKDAGLESVQFSFLAASRIHLGLIKGTKA